MASENISKFFRKKLVIPAVLLSGLAFSAINYGCGKEEKAIITPPVIEKNEGLEQCLDLQTAMQNGDYKREKCEDSDGYNPHVTGTTTGYERPGQLNSFTDSCIDSNFVQEYTCAEDNFVNATEYWCPDGCNEGACIGTPSCNDTDGNNPFEEGAITGFGLSANGEWLWNEKNDSCLANGAELLEYYCSFDRIKMEHLACPCSRETNACACHDSDGGSIYEKGIVSDSASSHEDACISDSKLQEWSCDASGVSSKEIDCENGCESGACKELVQPKKERSESCKEITPGQNAEEENRINFIIVGLNYESADNFKKLVDIVIDGQEQYSGMFSLEPFKSNKNKFNLWYVDEIGRIEEKDEGNPVAEYGAIGNLSELCGDLKNSVRMGLINYSFRSGSGIISFVDKGTTPEEIGTNCKNSDFNGDGCVDDYDMDIFWNEGVVNGEDSKRFDACYVNSYGCENGKSTDENLNEYLDDLYRYDVRTFVHELGHQFGLMDEYMQCQSGNCTIPEGVKAGYKENWPNCFVGTKEECESPANPQWYDLLGQGKDDTKIGCYEGCGFYQKGIFRSSSRSIMETIGAGWPSQFNLVQERIICENMIEKTGNVCGDCAQFGKSIFKIMK